MKEMECAQIPVLAPLFASCVTWSSDLNLLSLSLFNCGLFWGLNEVMHIKYQTQWLRPIVCIQETVNHGCYFVVIIITVNKWKSNKLFFNNGKAYGTSPGIPRRHDVWPGDVWYRRIGPEPSNRVMKSLVTLVPWASHRPKGSRTVRRSLSSVRSP